MALLAVHYGIDDIFGVVEPNTRRALFVFLRNPNDISPDKLVHSLINVIAMLLLVWVYMACLIKQLHDRNKSGWWMLAFFRHSGSL